MERDRGERLFSELVGSIYHAAVEPDGWPAVVAAMKRYLHCPTGLIYLQGGHDRKPSFAVMDGLDHGRMEPYYRHYISLNPNRLAKHMLPVGRATASNRIMRDRQWENTEYYYDFARHMDVFYQLGAHTHRGPDDSGVIGVFRPRHSTPFSDADIRGMERIVPHVRQAFRIASLLPGAQATLAAFIEFHSRGVFLIDAGGRIVLANRSGEGLLRQRDGLIPVEGRLSAMPECGKAALESAIHYAVLTGLGKGVHPGRALTIVRPSGKPPFQVLVTPLGELPARFQMGAQRICAAVFVADARAAPRTAGEDLREWFGLTAAEARIAQGLAEGESPAQVAQRIGVSRDTIRNQLKAIYEKTGVHRQAELVRLLLLIPAGAFGAPRQADDP